MGDRYFAPFMIGTAIFLFIIAFATIQYNKLLLRTRYGKEHPNDWLFHEFYLKVYSAIWGSKNPDAVAVKLGIDIEKYYQSCKILRIKPNSKKLIVHYIYGLFALIVSGLLSVLINFALYYQVLLLFSFSQYMIRKSLIKRRKKEKYR